QARWSCTGVAEQEGTTSAKSDSEPSSALKSSHCPIPPPMPLSGTGCWYSSGSHASSARRSANPGLISSHPSSGEEARPIAARTSATNDRTTGVSRTNSSATRHLRHHPAAAGQRLDAAEREVRGPCDAEPPRDLQPRLRQRVVDRDARPYRGDRRRVDAVHVAVAAGRVEERRHVEPA